MAVFPPVKCDPNPPFTTLSDVARCMLKIFPKQHMKYILLHDKGSSRDWNFPT